MLSLQLKIFPILTSIFRTFLNNMKAFGLGNDICKEFLHKMSTIGDLSEGKPTSYEKLGASRMKLSGVLIVW